MAITFDGSIEQVDSTTYRHRGGTVNTASATLSVCLSFLDPGAYVEIRFKVKSQNGKIYFLNEENPVTKNMPDRKTGKLNEDIMGERVMSAIIEGTMPREKLAAAIDVLRDVSQKIDTVFSLHLIDRPEGRVIPIQKILDEKGVKYYRNGKNNLGLGRPLIP